MHLHGLEHTQGSNLETATLSPLNTQETFRSGPRFVLFGRHQEQHNVDTFTFPMGGGIC